MKNAPPARTFSWKALLMGDSGLVAEELRHTSIRRLGASLALIVLGTGCYGASIGVWLGPLHAGYVAVKLPLAIVLTLGVNSLLNGMLARVLGGGLSFRQTFEALLLSFAVFSLVVGALCPPILFLTRALPGPDSAAAGDAHRWLLLFHTFVIAQAGIVSTRKLHGILRRFSGGPVAARATLLAWLAGNLFAGAQIGFMLRPIFGTPGLETVFLRPDPFEGNFYESVWWALRHTLAR
ncbi:MAG: hypothetical protein KDM91_08145 [Verrucomicrobiae bacterium]|nr:hypothetical protein [Verrucomicrobiae bacterium]MCP5538715.1 hypothetical protein [Akkermansiaceae bacterium]